MEIGLSAVVQKRVKNKELQAIENEDFAFCWDTHLIKHNNRNVLLIVNYSSRYTIAMTDITSKNWNDYEVYIIYAIQTAMKTDGYSENQINRYFQLAGQIKLTKTHGRRAVGGINRVMAAVEYYVDPYRKDSAYQAEMSDYLNHDICTPPGFEKFDYPVELFHLDMERLGIALMKKSAKIIDFPKQS